MPSLASLQALMRDGLLGGDPGPAAMAIAGDGLPPEARLAVYRHHVFTTLTDVLRAAYPAVCRLVDERFFAYAAHEFIRRSPPIGPCLVEYGGDLPGFLAAFPPCWHLAWLPDVARLEWALHRAAHADEPPPLAAARLAAVPPEAMPGLVFRFHPSASLLHSRWPVDLVWKGHRPVGPGAPVDLGAGGIRLEVRRLDGDAVMRTLGAAPFAFRRALHRGRSLAIAARTARAVDRDFDLAHALAELLAEGLLTDVSMAPTPD